jgi:nuclear mRNA export protein SAC3
VWQFNICVFVILKAPKRETELLNIDRAIQARLRKQEKSWSVLNTSELVTPILAEQNPCSRCLCWKLLLSLPGGPMDTLPTRWLLTKFNLDEAGLFVSISKTWNGPQLSLSFVRADKTSSFEKDSVAGASSILFLLSGDIPLEVHKERLHNLYNHVPSNSNLPLLIAISDGLNGKNEAAILAKLGIANIDQTKLRGISVIFLNQDPHLTSNGFLDDGRLREGVRWLAENSPHQSEVSLVNARIILLSYLKLKFEVLGDAYEMNPDQCVAAINESIDWLLRAILGSASANPNLWPCPETDLLDKYSSEKNYAEMTLPKTTWNEPLKVQAQMDVLSGCKLPCFGFDLSWLSQGCSCTDKQWAQDHKRSLEECLFNYLNMYDGVHEAKEQARDLVRRCTSLVLRESCFYLVPRWTAIFRRIFNMKLIGIAKNVSDVYVSEDIANVEYLNVQWKDLLVSDELPVVPLDEMIERCFLVGADTIIPAVPTVHNEAHEETQSNVDHGVVQSVCEVPEQAQAQAKALSVCEVPEQAQQVQKRSKFDMLLAQCTKIQDEIDKKLYLYF